MVESKWLLLIDQLIFHELWLSNRIRIIYFGRRCSRGRQDVTCMQRIVNNDKLLITWEPIWSSTIKLFGFRSFPRGQNFISTNPNNENTHVILNLATKTKIYKHDIKLHYRFLLFPMLSPLSAGPVIDQCNMQLYFNITTTDMPNFSCCNLMTIILTNSGIGTQMTCDYTNSRLVMLMIMMGKRRGRWIRMTIVHAHVCTWFFQLHCTRSASNSYVSCWLIRLFPYLSWFYFTKRYHLKQNRVYNMDNKLHIFKTSACNYISTPPLQPHCIWTVVESRARMNNYIPQNMDCDNSSLRLSPVIACIGYVILP